MNLKGLKNSLSPFPMGKQPGRTKMINNCGTCRFYNNVSCRRYPPTVVITKGIQGVAYEYISPWVAHSWWCGEFVHKVTGMPKREAPLTEENQDV